MGIDISYIDYIPGRTSFGFDALTTAFPGTTFVLGGTGYSGSVLPGISNPLPGNNENFIYYPTGPASNSEQLRTRGTVLMLAALPPPPPSTTPPPPPNTTPTHTTPHQPP